MVNLKAFATLERSAASAMQAEWQKAAEKALDMIRPLLEAGKFAEAHYEADRLTMTGVVEEQRLRLEELATSALLFGAHHATGRCRTSPSSAAHRNCRRDCNRRSGSSATWSSKAAANMSGTRCTT